MADRSVQGTRALEKLKPMLAAAKGDVTDKLAGQATGEFYLVHESSVTAVRSDESLVRTEQLPDKGDRGAGSPYGLN